MWARTWVPRPSRKRPPDNSANSHADWAVSMGLRGNATAIPDLVVVRRLEGDRRAHLLDSVVHACVALLHGRADRIVLEHATGAEGGAAVLHHRFGEALVDRVHALSLDVLVRAEVDVGV